MFMFSVEERISQFGYGWSVENLTDLKGVVEKAARIVTPSIPEERRLEKIVSKVTLLLDSAFAKEGAEKKPMIGLGGSYAKGTWLKGEADVDYFLQYPTSYPREKLETEAVKIAQ